METFNKKLKAILLLMGIVLFTMPIFATTYEDAEDNATTGWITYGDITDAIIENVVDSEKGSRVIKLTGNGKNTGFRLGNKGGRASYVGAWHNQTEKLLKWSMKYDEPFRIYIPIRTEHGNRFLTYTNQSVEKKGKIRGGKVSYGLGEDSIDGTWHTFTRDLEADWNAFMPNDPFVAVNGFFIKGSGYIDDVMSLDNSISNNPPIANAGVDKQVAVNSIVPIVGTGTDSDGTIVSYKWEDNGVELATTASFDYNASDEGNHTLLLTVTDNNGLTATDTMIVTVNNGVDTTKPIITLLGDNPVTLTVGDTYTDAGATAMDNVDGNITNKIKTISDINSSAEGNYTVTYSVSDKAGNEANISRSVEVIASLVNCDPLSEPLPTGLFTAQLTWSETRVSMGLSNRFMSKSVNGCGIAGAGSEDLTLYDVYKGTYPINVVDVKGYEGLEENLSDIATLQVKAVNVRKTYKFTVTEKYQYPNLGPDGGHVADIVVIQPDPTKPVISEVIPTAPSRGYGGSVSSGSWYFAFGGYSSVGGSVATIPVIQTNPPLCQPAKSCGCLPCEFQVLKYLNQARLGGPVSGADFILYKASEEDNSSREIIYQGKTTIGNKIEKAGLISLPVPYPQQTTYNEEEQALLDAIKDYDGDFILEVSGGVDIDKNDDLVVDSTFTPVNGKLHLILTKEKLLKNDYKVNILTEIAYKLSRDLLGENYDKARLQARLDEIGKRVFIEKLYPDANEALGRNDLFSWIPTAHKNWLVKPYDTTLAPIVNKVYAGEEIYNEAYNYVYNALAEEFATVPLLKSHWFSVDENATGGTLVGVVTPILEGNSSITGYSLSGSGSERFRIESDGKVYLKDDATLDYESVTIYQMQLRATNDDGDSRPVTLYITVNNISDAPEDRSFSGGVIAEDAIEGDVVGVMTFDAGASAIERIKIGGADASSFTVDTNGTIHVSGSANFDYETKNHANITLQAFNSLGGSRVVPIHIAITDAVDVPIVKMLDVHLEENATIGTVVGKVEILTNNPLTEVKLLGSEADKFSIESNGTVRVAKALDYETRANYVFQVKATNVQGTGRVGTLVIRIDNIPDVAQLNRTVLHVLEGSPVDTVVGSVSVGNVGASAIIGYALTGSGSENFTIDNSGVIRVNNATISHTTQEFFNLYATATNAEGTSLRARVVIYIDTQRPILGILNSWVYENSAEGTVIGTVPVASTGTPITSMRLEGTGAENFTIDANGVVRVATGATLDYETTSSYTLQVFATNSIGQSDGQTLYIRVINISDTIRLQGFSATVYEDTAKGSTIGFVNVLATGGKTIDHFVLSGAGSQNFTISNAGIVAISNTATLNSHAEPNYHIGVVAVDSNDNNSSEVFLDISVVDTINTPPKLSDVHLTVSENTPVGTTLGATTIVSKTALVEQTWLIGEGKELFELSKDGNIVLKQPLDYETKHSYSLGMYARNALGTSEVASLSIDVVSNSVNLNNGLVAHYEFEGNAKDSSGNGNDGTEHGGVTYVDGVSGKSLKLNGSNHISLNSFNNKDIEHGLTFSFWAKRNNKDKNRVVISQYYWGYYEHVYYISLGDSMNASYYYNLDGTNSDGISYSISNQNIWHYFTINVKSKKLQLWIDGELKKEISRQGDKYVSNSSVQTYIGNTGSAGDGSDKHFIGELDDLRIYNRALTEAEIKALYKHSSCDASTAITREALITKIANGDDVTQVNTCAITDMSSLFYNNSTFNQDISKWDVSNVTNMSRMFLASSTFNQDISKWDVSNVTNMSQMFDSASAFNQDISKWDVSNVTNMNSMFWMTLAFNQPLNDWNVSNVTNMYNMFGLTNLFNQPLNNWDVSKVTNMGRMFNGASAFNQDISDWNVSNVQNCDNFAESSPLEPRYNPCYRSPEEILVTRFYAELLGRTPDTEGFNDWVSRLRDQNKTVAHVARGFVNSQEFKDRNLSNRDYVIALYKGLLHRQTFSEAEVNYWLDKLNDGTLTRDGVLDGFINSNEFRTKYANYYQRLTKELPLASANCQGHITKSGLDTNENGLLDDNEIDSSEEHYDNGTPITREDLMAKIGNGDDVMQVNTCKITDMSHLFDSTIYSPEQNETVSNFNQDISGWNTGIVTTMANMFGSTKTFNQDIGSWDVSSVTDMSRMFYNARNFNQDIENWNVSNVTNMSGMFLATSVFNQPLNNWDVSSVTDMSQMFDSVSAFNQDINNWDVSNVTNMNSMFWMTLAFNQPLNNWDVSNVTNMYNMFGLTNLFNQPLNNWDVANVTNMEIMFYQALSFNQDISNWNVSNVQKFDNFSYHSPLKDRYNPFYARILVKRFYLELLGRDIQPDNPYFQAWVNSLNNHTKTVADVARGFVHSQEFQERNLSNKDFLTALYKGLLCRNPDEAGLNNWLTKLNDGTLTREEVLDGFINSNEFHKKYDSFSSTLTLKYTEQFNNFTPNGGDWTSGGYPLPRKVSISDAEDGYAWDSNGDGWHHSGSYLNKFKLPWNKEFKVDFRLKQPLSSTSNYWLYLDLALSTTPFTSDNNYGRNEAKIRISGGSANNSDTPNVVSAYIAGDNKERRIEVNYNDGKWHIYAIHHKINSLGAREIDILIDGKSFHKEVNTDYLKNEDFYIDINGRSYQLDNYLDYVKVYMEK